MDFRPIPSQLRAGVNHLRRESTGSCRVPEGRELGGGAQRRYEMRTGTVLRAVESLSLPGEWPSPHGKYHVLSKATAVTELLNPLHLPVKCYVLPP